MLQSSTIACFLACLLLSQGFPTSFRASRITDCCEVTRLWRAPNWWEEQRVIARFPSCRRRAPWAPANLASHPRTRNGPTTTTTSTFPSPYCTHKLLSHNSSRFLLGRYHDQQHACCCSLSLSLSLSLSRLIAACHWSFGVAMLFQNRSSGKDCWWQWKQQLWFCYVVQHKSLASLLGAIWGFGFAMLFKQTLG